MSIVTSPAKKKQSYKPSEAHASTHLWAKIMKADEETQWLKQEVMTVMHWLKQIIAVLCALVAGLVPLQGLYGFVFFLASLAFIPIAVCRSVLK